jgi:hypothetical protein
MKQHLKLSFCHCLLTIWNHLPVVQVSNLLDADMEAPILQLFFQQDSTYLRILDICIEIYFPLYLFIKDDCVSSLTLFCRI